MIPHRIRFTGLEFDPDDVADRWHRGVIPLDWSRNRFIIQGDIQNPITLLNRWLGANIEGKWSIWLRYIEQNKREVNVAFENDFDGITFLMSNGKAEAFKNAERNIF